MTDKLLYFETQFINGLENQLMNYRLHPPQHVNHASDKLNRHPPDTFSRVRLNII